MENFAQELMKSMNLEYGDPQYSELYKCQQYRKELLEYLEMFIELITRNDEMSIDEKSTMKIGVAYRELRTPWEEVDAFYYPNKNDLTIHFESKGYDSIEDCRSWVKSYAYSVNDQYLTKGDYECGVGYLEDYHGINIYRLTLR